MAYFISDLCMCCSRCAEVCPASAISFDGDKMAVDPGKCIDCGTCSRYCMTGAANNSTAPSAGGESEYICDLVVIGGGGSGMMAAARFAYLTGKKVIVLEKMPKTGGAAVFAMDFRMFGSRWQKEHGIEERFQENLLLAMDETQWKLDPRLVENCFTATGRLFDWVGELNPGSDDLFREGSYVFDSPIGAAVPSYIRKGRKADGAMGQYMMDTMLRVCREKGVTILTGHSATEIITENGVVTGVTAEGPRGRVDISCRACILSCGSWINNKQALKRCCPEFAAMPHARNPHMSPAYTGDGIKLAEDAGAFIDYDSFVLRFMGPMVPNAGVVAGLMCDSHYCLTVNLRGERWIEGDVSNRMGFFKNVMPLLHQPEGMAVYVFCADNLLLAQEDLKGTMVTDIDLQDFPGTAYAKNMAARGRCNVTAPEDFIAEMEKSMEKYPFSIFRADTPEKLAEITGVDPAGLRRSIDDYNARIADGRVDALFKPDKYRAPMINGPFYAVKGGLGTDGAFGGVPVDPEMRAKKADSSTVPGLYVTGDFASGRFINNGGFKNQIINDIAWAFASGFLAGESAADYLK